MRGDEGLRIDAGTAGGDLAALVAEQLPQWLPSQRWFGDKGRAIEAVELVAALSDPENGPIHLTVVRVRFRAGEPALYALPLTIARGSAQLADATALPQFGRWFLERFLERGLVDAGQWRFAVAGSGETIERAVGTPAALMGAEQSNTSIRYDEALIAKLVRRLQPGPNPDAEILRALSETTFHHAPALVGTASWRAAPDSDVPIALVQEYVPNRGDGWTWILQRLAEFADSGKLTGDLAPEQRLGQRTAELHLALSGLTSPAFVPEPTLAQAVQEQMAQTEQASLAAAALLVDRQNMLSPVTRRALPDVVEALQHPDRQVAGFRAEIGRPRARVHGDFHLGQTLRTLDDDWEIIDFEGEPARPVSERRRKYSVLKDVAGMLRSFAYARGAAARSARWAEGQNRLADWEQGARQAFLDAYRRVLQDASSSLVPEDDASFAGAVAAWEFDKAVYEIAYEARNRPDWLDIPLRSLFPELFA